ncbi:ATP-binding protein [Streptomyces chartreusis]|uniref:ATP-binding protein n=1 Tax=Streptomyces chartreusis TaxID=1969 RepID=UPI002F91B78B
MRQAVSAALGFRPEGVRTNGADLVRPTPDAEAQSPGSNSGPVRPQTWTHKWPTEASVPRLARLHARTRLGMMAWSGDRETAVRVITEAVRNAVQHAGTGTVELTLIVDEHDLLHIDVTDPRPGNEFLDQALTGRTGTGLWLVRQLGGAVRWLPATSGNGKTIQILMRPMVSGPTPPIVEAP